MTTQMPKPDFHFTPREFFTFFLVTEPDTSHLREAAHKLARGFSASVESSRYGNGVKSITATLVLTNPEGLGKLHKVKRPRYTAGPQTIKAHGIVVSTEDTLEFGIRPPFEGLRDAMTESQLAGAIVRAITQVGPNLRALKVPDFDMDRFLSDLMAFLRRAGEQDVYTH